MSFGNAIKRYVQGLLLILLAVFILGAVSYISTIVPDTTLSTSGASMTRYELISSSTRNITTSGWYFTSLGYTMTTDNNVYILVASYTGGFDKISDLRVAAGGFATYSGPPTRYNDTIGYLVIPSNVTIDAYGGHFYSSGTLNMYFLKAPPGADPVLVIAVLFEDSNVVSSAPSISNKLIINFIGWISSIILVIISLHRFNIQI